MTGEEVGAAHCSQQRQQRPCTASKQRPAKTKRTGEHDGDAVGAAPHGRLAPLACLLVVALLACKAGGGGEQGVRDAESRAEPSANAAGRCRGGLQCVSSLTALRLVPLCDRVDVGAGAHGRPPVDDLEAAAGELRCAGWVEVRRGMGMERAARSRAAAQTRSANCSSREGVSGLPQGQRLAAHVAWLPRLAGHVDALPAPPAEGERVERDLTVESWGLGPAAAVAAGQQRQQARPSSSSAAAHLAVKVPPPACCCGQAFMGW